ncbi:MAG: hypothetical protein R3B54_00350 [Bdellovibrionota bacterium]
MKIVYAAARRSSSKLASRCRALPAVAAVLKVWTAPTWEWGSVGFAFRVAPGSPVFLGMDVGYNYWDVRIKEQQNGTEITRSVSLNSLQMLASIYYRFLDNQNTKAHPYIGFSIGPNLTEWDDKIQMGGKR